MTRRQRHMAAGERNSNEHPDDKELREMERGKGFSKTGGKEARGITKRNQTPHPHTRRRVDGGMERKWATTTTATSVDGDRAELALCGVVSKTNWWATGVRVVWAKGGMVESEPLFDWRKK